MIVATQNVCAAVGHKKSQIVTDYLVDCRLSIVILLCRWQFANLLTAAYVRLFCVKNNESQQVVEKDLYAGDMCTSAHSTAEDWPPGDQRTYLSDVEFIRLDGSELGNWTKSACGNTTIDWSSEAGVIQPSAGRYSLPCRHCASSAVYSQVTWLRPPNTFMWTWKVCQRSTQLETAGTGTL